ncbi:PIG-L deacetylase family protein [Shewanella sp. UCD-KL12]|uniref:PIG-L deacetylase family protein n=1 Tax=Shewanella sp. UCD-KL12 TaxID=1917163 RepID=UPI0009F9BE9C|nr:PIG-L family deacetylase [Shewanella sp. UCD-KL12]
MAVLKQVSKKEAHNYRIALLTYIVIMLCVLSACQLNREKPMGKRDAVIVLLAHPDDETWISGTLAKLAVRGLEVIPVYATSGDKGSDRSGRGLSGDQLAEVREREAIMACQTLDVSSPIFLRFADGKLNQFQSELLAKFQEVVEQVEPAWILSFIRGGITDNRDHKVVNKLVSQHYSSRAVYFAVSDTRAIALRRSAEKFGINYSVAVPIENSLVTHRVDVSQYQKLRTQAMSQHVSQFPPVMVSAFGDFTQNTHYEELVLGENEELNGLLQYLD